MIGVSITYYIQRRGRDEISIFTTIGPAVKFYSVGGLQI